MIQPQRPRLRLLLFVTLSLLLLSATGTVRAEDFVQGDTIAAGQTVENDVFLNGDNVVMAGTVDGDVFAVGRNIKIDGQVSGSLFAIGETIEVSGQVEGSVYTLGVSSDLQEEAAVGRSLYFLGLSVGTADGSQIGRDLVVVSLGARLRGDVGRDTKALIGLIEIGRMVLDGLARTMTGKLESEAIAIGATGAGAPAQAGLQVMAASALPRAAAVRLPAGQLQQAALTPEQVVEWVADFLRGLVSFLLVGVLALWLVPDLFSRWQFQLRRRPWAALGLGLVAYISGFAGAVIALVLVVALGVALAAISLWGLAITWWGLALSALGLAFFTFLLLVIYMSKVLVAYVAGVLILRRLAPRASRPIWALTLGLIIFVILCMIPTAGFVIAAVVTFLGLGAVVLAYMARRPLYAG